MVNNIATGKLTLGVIIGNRDFFPDSLINDGRAELLRVLDELGIGYVVLDPGATPLGAVETWDHAKICAALFRQHADEIAGAPCYRSVSAIPERVGAVVVVVPPARSAEVVEECVRLGIRNVWLQQGAESPDATRAAERADLHLVQNECVMMFARPRGIHRLHRWLREHRRRDPSGGPAQRPTACAR